jgi:hypothetical protein
MRRRTRGVAGAPVALAGRTVVIVMAVAMVVMGVAMMAGSGSARAGEPPGATGWRVLFDGGSTDAWRGWISGVLPAGWKVVDGELTKQDQTEDLVTREQFGNFELEFDWKIGRGGNSGLFYRGTREYEHIYWSAPEYQLLDDANAPDGRSRLTAAASDYGLYPAPAGVVKPFGEWNTSRILVNGSHVEHWLNGVQVVTYEVGSADWKARVAASKFAAYPRYGLAKRGFIGIQGDHPGTLALRHIRIRELP